MSHCCLLSTRSFNVPQSEGGACVIKLDLTNAKRFMTSSQTSTQMSSQDNRKQLDKHLPALRLFLRLSQVACHGLQASFHKPLG